jgi:hypothetical protein
LNVLCFNNCVSCCLNVSSDAKLKIIALNISMVENHINRKNKETNNIIKKLLVVLFVPIELNTYTYAGLYFESLFIIL